MYFHKLVDIVLTKRYRLAEIKRFTPTKSQFILKFNYKNLLLTFWSFLSKCPKIRNNYPKMQTLLPEVTSTRVIYWLIGIPAFGIMQIFHHYQVLIYTFHFLLLY